jgi:hypothetical protein
MNFSPIVHTVKHKNSEILKLNIDSTELTAQLVHISFLLCVIAARKINMDVARLRDLAIKELTSYSTSRVIRIHSWKIAMLHRLFQLAVLVGLVGWNILYEKSYQTIDRVSSTLTSKVKGLGYVSDEANRSLLKVFDTADYIIPPSDHESVCAHFIASHFLFNIIC